jgi:hypothetical protein
MPRASPGQTSPPAPTRPRGPRPPASGGLPQALAPQPKKPHKEIPTPEVHFVETYHRDYLPVFVPHSHYSHGKGERTAPRDTWRSGQPLRRGRRRRSEIRSAAEGRA